MTEVGQCVSLYCSGICPRYFYVQEEYLVFKYWVAVLSGNQVKKIMVKEAVSAGMRLFIADFFALKISYKLPFYSDDFPQFIPLASELSQRYFNALIMDGGSYSYESRDEIIKLIELHITQNLILVLGVRVCVSMFVLER